MNENIYKSNIPKENPYFANNSKIKKKIIKLKHIIINKGNEIYYLFIILNIISFLQCFSLIIEDKIWESNTTLDLVLNYYFPFIRISNLLSLISPQSFLNIIFVLLAFVFLYGIFTIIIYIITSNNEYYPFERYNFLYSVWIMFSIIIIYGCYISLNDLFLSSITCFKNKYVDYNSICSLNEIYNSVFILSIILLNIYLIFFIYLFKSSNCYKIYKKFRLFPIPFESFQIILFYFIHFLYIIMNKIEFYTQIKHFIIIFIYSYSLYIHLKARIFENMTINKLYLFMFSFLLWTSIWTFFIIEIKLFFDYDWIESIIIEIIGLILILSIFLLNSFKFLNFSLKNFYFRANIQELKSNQIEIDVLSNLYDSFILKEDNFEYLFEIYLTNHIDKCDKINCKLHSLSSLSKKETINEEIINYLYDKYTIEMDLSPDILNVHLKFINFSKENKMNMTYANSILNKYQSYKNLSIDDIFEIYLLTIESANKDKEHLSISLQDEEENLLKKNENSINNENNSKITKSSDINNVTNVNNKSQLEIILEMIFISTKTYNELWACLSSSSIENINISEIFHLVEIIYKNNKEIDKKWKEIVENKKFSKFEMSILEKLEYYFKYIKYDEDLSLSVKDKINKQKYVNDESSDEFFNLSNIDMLLEKDQLICYSRINLLGECKILKTSLSFKKLLCYGQNSLENKPIESIIPAFLRFYHTNILSKKLDYLVKENSVTKTNQEKFSYSKIFNIFVLTKDNYIIPLLQNITIKRDFEVSNSFIAKSLYESIDEKGDFFYHLLINEGGFIQNISSNCVNIGLTNELINQEKLSVNDIFKSKDNKFLYYNDYIFNDKDKFLPIIYNFSEKLNIIKYKNKFMQLQIKKYNYSTINNFILYHFILKEFPLTKSNFSNIPISFNPVTSRPLVYDLNSQSYKICQITSHRELLKNGSPFSILPKNLSIFDKFVNRKRLSIESVNSSSFPFFINNQSEYENETSKFNFLSLIENIAEKYINEPSLNKNDEYKNDDNNSFKLSENNIGIELESIIVNNLKDKKYTEILEFIENKLINYSKYEKNNKNENVILIKRNHKLDLEEDFRNNIQHFVIEMDNFQKKMKTFIYEKTEDDLGNIDSKKNILFYKPKINLYLLVSFLFPFKIKKFTIFFFIIFFILTITLSLIKYISSINKNNKLSIYFNSLQYSFQLINYSYEKNIILSQIRRGQIYMDIIKNTIYDNSTDNFIDTGLLDKKTYLNYSILYDSSSKNKEIQYLKTSIYNNTIINKETLISINKNFSNVIDNIKTIMSILDHPIKSYYINYLNENNNKVDLLLIDYYQKEIVQSFQLVQDFESIFKSENLNLVLYNTIKSSESMLNILNKQQVEINNLIKDDNIILVVINIVNIVFLIILGIILISEILRSRERVIDLVLTIKKSVYKKFKKSSDAFYNQMIFNMNDKEDIIIEDKNMVNIQNIYVKESDIETNKFYIKNKYNSNHIWDRETIKLRLFLLFFLPIYLIYIIIEYVIVTRYDGVILNNQSLINSTYSSIIFQNKLLFVVENIYNPFMDISQLEKIDIITNRNYNITDLFSLAVNMNDDSLKLICVDIFTKKVHGNQESDHQHSNDFLSKYEKNTKFNGSFIDYYHLLDHKLENIKNYLDHSINITYTEEFFYIENIIKEVLLENLSDLETYTYNNILNVIQYQQRDLLIITFSYIILYIIINVFIFFSIRKRINYILKNSVNLLYILPLSLCGYLINKITNNKGEEDEK